VAVELVNDSDAWDSAKPLRVRQGERAVAHSRCQRHGEHPIRPGRQRFQRVGLDANPMPNPPSVDVLEFGAAECVHAVVRMKNPGVWILGTPHDDDRQNGTGRRTPGRVASRAGSTHRKRPGPTRFSATAANQRPRQAHRGVLKEVVVLKGYRRVHVDFIPAEEGLTLFHYHRQLRMDTGSRGLFNIL
jgi:FtsP/CotA-like multicopper oxidase with cupredoxin domain